MGITFRNGSYIRFVRFGGRTIKDGEAAMIWNNRGVARLALGPQRVTLWYSTVRFLDRFKAEEHEYLKIRHRSGRVEHMHGPVSMYINPALHDAIEVKQGVHLETEDDCIVVFSNLETSTKSSEKISTKSSEKVQSSERNLVYGPSVYFPVNGEGVHAFEWKVPSADLSQPLVSEDKMAFTVLSTSKSFFWKTKLILLSSESHHVPVELSISYQIASVEKCAQAQDPFQTLEPALLHDANQGSLSEKSIRKSELNESSFPTFCEAMGQVGFRLLKIQVLGTKMSMESKTAAQKRSQKESQRTMEEKVLEAKTAHAQNLEYLQGLQELGVDLTTVLVASAGKVEPLMELVPQKA